MMATADIVQILIKLSAALAAGLLVGMQRGWSLRDRKAGTRVAGFRTFGLFGLAGGIAGLSPDIVAGALAFGTIGLIVVGYAKEAEQDTLSATTAIAGVLTFAAGFAAVRQSPEVGLAIGAAIFIILSARQSMHALLKGMSETEIDGAARFALVALVILPLLPDAQFGPYGALNPRQIWMVVVFVMGLSFIGYVATRRFGRKQGIVIVALTGAIVSSTAVTADYARRLRHEPEARGALIAGIAVASIVMFVRVQLLSLILVPRAVPTLIIAMAPATLVASAFALFALREHGQSASAPELKNPFSFIPAIVLAVMVAVLSLVSHWASERFGSEGIAVVLGLTGLSDVDAAVITLAGLPTTLLDDHSAGMVLAIPILANTAFKAAMTVAIARGSLGWRASLPLWSSLLASGAAMIGWQLL